MGFRGGGLRVRGLGSFGLHLGLTQFAWLSMTRFHL